MKKNEYDLCLNSLFLLLLHVLLDTVTNFAIYNVTKISINKGKGLPAASVNFGEHRHRVLC